MRSKTRKRSGSSMTEVGPGLVILLMFIFWPALDLVSLLVSYCFVKTLNSNQAHEASLVPYTDAQSATGAVMKTIPEQWEVGLGKYMRMQGHPQTTVTYRNGQQSSDNDAANITDKTVTVGTIVLAEPMLPIPLFGAKVVGLNAPMVLSVSSDRPMENSDNAP